MEVSQPKRGYPVVNENNRERKKRKSKLSILKEKQVISKKILKIIKTSTIMLTGL